ncbi:CIA30 family protein [Accumulibacter sp.]|uniref:CIA30 family protein n=1 Tax=Accumulibacter sp. TaxID=2053492 RepID=UPI0035B27450
MSQWRGGRRTGRAFDHRASPLAAADFMPTWRGRVIDDLPPPDLACARQIGLLIAERQEGRFKLDLRAIDLVD